MDWILDAGFFFALIDDKDEYHRQVIAAIKTVRGKIILPVPAITETAYLINRESGAEKLADFLDLLSETDFILETPTSEDYKRAAEIIRKYSDANIDFVDSIIVAIAERLNVTKVLTVDTRHFRMFRPSHCETFEILP